MDEYTFLKEKERVVNFAKEQLSKPGQTILNIEALTVLLKQLEKYTYENRFKVKGLMTHTIIDSLELDYSLDSRFILFDKMID